MLELPAARGVDLVLELALSGEERVHLVRFERLAELVGDLVPLREQTADLADTFLDDLADRLLVVDERFLLEEADPGALGGEGLAEELLVHAGHHPHQRALPGAVRAEDPDLRAREEREPDVLEDHLFGRDELAESLHGEDDVGHRFLSVVCRSRVQHNGLARSGKARAGEDAG